jgi:hypothetical protein
VRGPHENEAEYYARTRGEVVDSQSPTDIVPNMPQISFGPQELAAAPVTEADVEAALEAEKAEGETESQANHPSRRHK